MPKTKRDVDKGKMIHIRLTDESHTRLRILVAEQKSTIQEWVSTLIESQLNRGKSGTSRQR